MAPPAGTHDGSPAVRWRRLSRLAGAIDGHHVHRTWRGIVGLAATGLALQVAAVVGLCSIAGFSAVATAFSRVSWPWLGAAFGAVVVSWLGYLLAYVGIFRVRRGRTLDPGQMTAVSLAGFSGFLSLGSALDTDAIRAAGAGRRDAKVRVSAFGGLEQGVLALGGCGAAIVVLVIGLARPSLGYTLPWAVAPVPGFILAVWLARRYGERWRHQRGWRGFVGVFLEGVDVVAELFRRPVGRDAAVIGMGLFWAGEVAVVWCALAAFGFQMGVAALIVGYATGMVFTRRAIPLGGAGLIMLALPLTLWVSGAPLATSIVAVFSYRVLTVWLPLPASLAALPTLRTICPRQAA